MSESVLHIHEDGDNHSGGTKLDDVTRILASERIQAITPAASTLNTYKVMVGIGAAVFLIGVLIAPQRVWGGVLLNSFYLLGLALAGLFFVAVNYVSNAGWAVVLRRVPEAMVGLLPCGAVGIASVLVLYPSIYEWTVDHEGAALVGFKGLWLNYGFFLARAALFIAIWIVFARRILRHSRAQDTDGDVEHTHRNTALSAVFIVLFSLSFWLASVDWIMSLEPHWFSTIFGVYNFSGLFSSGIACIIILVVWLQKQGALQGIVNEEHLHDLGKLLLGFTTFWAYIWFSQYMLIWYANIPEETGHYIVRTSGMWGPLFVLNVTLNWAVPFLMLLPRGCKRSTSIMVKVAVVVLVGRWLDLYLMIFPAISPQAPTFGAWEIGITLGAVGLFGVFILAALNRAPLVPLKDPLLRESMQHHQ